MAYRLSGRVDAAELQAFCGQRLERPGLTDSRSKYQFYPLARLWRDIETALAAGLTVLNLTPPPVSAAEVYAHLTGASGRTIWPPPQLTTTCAAAMRRCWAGRAAICARKKRNWRRSPPL